MLMSLSNSYILSPLVFVTVCSLSDSSYGWTSLEAWQFLHSIYGGGPEYKIVRKSSMETTDNESNEERDLTS